MLIVALLMLVWYNSTCQCFKVSMLASYLTCIYHTYMTEQTPFLTPRERQLSEVTEIDFAKARTLRNLAYLSMQLQDSEVYFAQLRKRFNELTYEQLVQIGAHATMLADLLPKPIDESVNFSATIPQVGVYVTVEHEYEEQLDEKADAPTLDINDMQASNTVFRPDVLKHLDLIDHSSDEYGVGDSDGTHTIDTVFRPDVIEYLGSIGFSSDEYGVGDADVLSRDIVDEYMGTLSIVKPQARENLTETVRAFLLGESKKDIARLHGVTQAAVAQRLKSVRNALAVSTGAPSTDTVQPQTSPLRPSPSVMPQRISVTHLPVNLESSSSLEEVEAIDSNVLNSIMHASGISNEDKPVFLEHFSTAPPSSGRDASEGVSTLHRCINRFVNYVNREHEFLTNDSLSLTQDEQAMMRRICAAWYIDPHTKAGIQARNPVMTPVYEIVHSSRRDSKKTAGIVESALKKILGDNDMSEVFDDWRKDQLEQIALQPDESAAFARWIDHRNQDRERDDTTKKALNMLQTRLASGVQEINNLSQLEQSATRMTLVDPFGINTIEKITAKLSSAQEKYTPRDIEKAILRGAIAISRQNDE